MKNQTAVLILGHYRSGTSLMARVINLLGVPLGLPEYEQEVYIKGITPTKTWEHPHLASVALYLEEKDRMFMGAYSKEHFANPVYDCMRVKAKNILEAIFEDYPIYAIKHPAICLTYPFWNELITAKKMNIICIRHPFASIKSTKLMTGRVDDNNIAKQWAVFTWSCFAYPVQSNSMCVFYDDMIEDPSREAGRVAKFLSLDVQKKALRSVHKDLRRETSTFEGLDLSDHTAQGVVAMHCYLKNQSQPDLELLTNLTTKVITS
jgi:hypothetical protein